MKITKITLAILLLLLQGCATHSAFREIRKADQLGHYESAIILATPLAEQGSARAQFMLASHYEMGEGVDQNYQAAVRWYNLAAGQGHVDAQNTLGVIFDQGLGVNTDDARAIKWYTRAARQGDSAAQYNLGFMYQTQNTAPNNTCAYLWWSISTRLGNLLADGQLDQLREEMTPEQVRIAGIMARRCLKKNYRGCLQQANVNCQGGQLSLNLATHLNS